MCKFGGEKMTNTMNQVTTVWEYLDGNYSGLRFSSGDVNEWPRCKLIAREDGMSEERRLALVMNGRSLSEHIALCGLAKILEAADTMWGQRNDECN